MANCNGCPFRWHDSDCEYCSMKNDEVIDLKNYSKETCPYYKAYLENKGQKSSSNSNSSSSYSSSSASTTGNPFGCFIAVGVIAMMVAGAYFMVTDDKKSESNQVSVVGSNVPSESSNELSVQEPESFNSSGEMLTPIDATVTSSLNMRTGPGTNNKIICVLSKGDKLKVLAQESDWAYVEIDGKFGWCGTKYLDFSK